MLKIQAGCVLHRFAEQVSEGNENTSVHAMPRVTLQICVVGTNKPIPKIEATMTGKRGGDGSVCRVGK